MRPLLAQSGHLLPLNTACLFNPVFQHQARHPLKLSHIIRHEYRAGGDGVSGNRRVVRADRRPGEAQCHLNLRGGGSTPQPPKFPA